MRVLDTPTFCRQAKRLRANQKVDLDQAVRDLLRNPLLGESKKGDLAWVRVHKFRLVGQLSLLAYEFRPEQGAIILHALGSHENFYRAMKAKQ